MGSTQPHESLLREGERPHLSARELKQPVTCLRCGVDGYRASERRCPTAFYRQVVPGVWAWFCLECDPGRPPIRIPQVGERVRVVAMNDETSRPELMGCEGTVLRLLAPEDDDEDKSYCGESKDDPMIDVALDGIEERWQFWKEEVVPLADLDLQASRARVLSVIGQGGFLVGPIPAPAPEVLHG